METAPAPRRMNDGFRERGVQVTRVEAFVDAAFAFALTLLVISVERVPASIDELLGALKAVPAFAASFAQLAMFWYAHARWSRRYGLDDFRSTMLSLLLVFLALVYIYPLKLLFGTFFAWISDGWFPSPLAEVGGYRDIRIMFMVYGVAFATMALCIAALFRQAARQADALGLDREERAMTAGNVASWYWMTAVAGLSGLCAAMIPDSPPRWLAGAPGMVFFLMNLAWPVSAAAYRRSLRRQDAGRPA